MKLTIWTLNDHANEFLLLTETSKCNDTIKMIIWNQKSKVINTLIHVLCSYRRVMLYCTCIYVHVLYMLNISTYLCLPLLWIILHMLTKVSTSFSHTLQSFSTNSKWLRFLNCSDEVWAYRVQNCKTKAIHNTDIRNDATCTRLVHVS